MYLCSSIPLINWNIESLIKSNHQCQLVRALETWVFGAILALVGLLVSACSLGKNELGISYMIAGLTSVILGSLIFVTKFKQWIEKL
jgi:hypothetical protein